MLNLFAEDFAERQHEDIDVDILVGFCLAVRRSVLEEIGSFDENFGMGTFEDNDLCYRIRRAGYRLQIATRSYVQHAGSNTILRMPSHPAVMLRNNHERYLEKWREDIESGFASHLSGLSAEPIVFQTERKPETRRQKMQSLARRADISLCMIVKNEERVLGDCLRTAKPFFNQIIVVDTGSTDRTKEIAEEHGAEVYDYPWTDSFSDARNQSLKYAKGKWIFWLDADDTLPWESGEAIVKAALEAPNEIVGFVVPVQFVEESIGGGTRVDHVKLFRNLLDIEFEGRIHEQILHSLRKHNGSIARIDAVVMHSGYDTSEEGQARKRQRDEKLLKLDLAERPDHPFVLFNLGMTAHYTGGHKDAIDWLQKCLSVSEQGESHVRKAYALLAVSQKELGEKEEAVNTLLSGIKAVGDDPELHFQAGLILTELGRYEEAREHYIKAEGDISGHFSSIDMGILGHKRLYNLGTLCMLMQNYKEARDWWSKCIQVAPTFTPTHFALFDAALETGDLTTAKQVIDTIYAQEGPNENWVRLGRQYAENVGGRGNAEQFLRQATATHEHKVAPRLALGHHLLEDGRDYEALDHLTRLQQMGSAEAAYVLGVYYIRRDDYEQALKHMEVAQELNPKHTQTNEQLQNLRKAIEVEAAV